MKPLMVAGKMALAVLAAGGAASLAAGVSASGQSLRSPWDGEKIAAIDAPYACPAPPAFSPMPQVEGYYTDKQYSVIDPKAQAAFEEATAGPNHLEQYAVLAAAAWRHKGSRDAARCVYSLLTAAAEADAWDARMPDNNGVYVQNWMLSGTAMAYLKVRDSGLGTPAQELEIQKWFELLARRVREYFDASSARPGTDAWNNHDYWAGLAVAAEGVADNDQDAFVWGLETYRRGIDAIQPDGSLTAEMGRGQRALHYQIYALGPLVMMAELGEANGIDLYAERDAAMKDPAIIATRVGVKQTSGPPYTGQEIGWAVPWVHRFPNAQLSAWIAQAPWVNLSSWGGAPPDGKTPAMDSAADKAFEAELRRKVQAAFAEQFPATRAQIARFFGEWCAEGNPEWKSSIADQGNVVVLTTQTGDTSTGEAKAPNVLVARAWGPVVGTLTPDGSQIDWTNGSYWEKCTTGAASSRTQLAGTWYPMGMPVASTIRQQGHKLQLDNGQGGSGTGQVDAEGHLTTVWNGQRITGVVTADGNHINWDNGTYWTRASVYESKRN
jgi:poly(beta-D-mannuronate) lyase